ncbi:TonB-dependent receptor [Fulvivirgaceae bacterium BMA12]|uniref:TonB-dependent receptor n=1 Tax=Agaribacillus aureus TaxID=3051825 RepID=A0ABT8LFY2_9BACT|nr:TonB-dependent receptor [Fulvivirgaceae bacterium BMA12]
MKYLYTIIICSLISFQSLSQSQHTISGYVRDGSSGEEMIGATVTINELPGTGTVSNAYGYYSLTLPSGNYTLKYNYIGYETITKEIDLKSNMKLDISLAEEQLHLEEIVVQSEKPEDNVTDVKMSREKLQVEKIKALPALFGEVDLIKTLQLLPGIQSAGEGTTGLFVRGGSSDQNLMLLDEATVYNASHFLGFFSVFNADAIKNVEIYKGGIPARFGGRLSSILDIQMKEGNNKKFAMSGGIGSVSSRLTVEGPIVKDKSSFIISGRRTYADLFLRLSPNEDVNSNILYFYDLNAKANYRIDDKNRVFVSGYFGRDVFDFDDTFGLDWGNATVTTRWNHLFNDRLFLNTTVLFSNFGYGFDIDDGVQSFEWKSNLQEYSAKLDFTYFINPNNTLSFGVNSILHRFEPATITPGDNSIFIDFALDNRYALEHALYIGNDHKINEKLLIQYGLRYSIFENIGPGKVFLYEEGVPRSDETLIDSIRYDRLERINLYHGLEPRFAARYILNRQSSVKASYNRMRQYIQVASNSTAGLPIDRWIPADNYIEPLIGDQVALGYFRNFKDNTFEASVEVYYKWMDNLIDFKPAAEILLNNNIETEILSGKGWAYGAEFTVKKNVGKTTGWFGYTIAKTERQIDGINDGKKYNAKYDRTHDISLVVSHEMSPRLTLSANWVYATGQAVSFPVGRYNVDGRSIPYYDDLRRNADRMPSYHRLDLSANLKAKNKKNKRLQRSWSFSIYNAYARKNAFSITFEDIVNEDVNYDSDEDGPETSRRPGSVKLYLFSLIPSVTYNFKF